MTTELTRELTEGSAEEAAINLPTDLFERLNADLKRAAATMTQTEARFLVDYYYQSQENRKRSSNQKRAHSESAEPNLVLDWMAECTRRLENSVKLALQHYSDGQFVGQWLTSIYGVGPVLSAGLLAHLDVKKAKGAGAFWRYAGLDPSVEWKKGEKRPWNAALKVLCWKFADVQTRFKGRKECYYGRLMEQKWEKLKEQNEAGQFADAAAAKLEKYRIGKTTDAYKAYSAGLLPPAHVLARAKRWIAKLLLSHLYDLMFALEHKRRAPQPYAFAILGHDDSHAMYPPGFDEWVERAISAE